MGTKTPHHLLKQNGVILWEFILLTCAVVFFNPGIPIWADAATLDILEPSSTNVYSPGDELLLRWESENVSSNTFVDFWLYRHSDSWWLYLGYAPTYYGSAGAYSILPSNITYGNDYFVYAESQNLSVTPIVYAWSDAFTVKAAFVEVSSPSAGSSYTAGENVLLVWQSAGLVGDFLEIQLRGSDDGKVIQQGWYCAAEWGMCQHPLPGNITSEESYYLQLVDAENNQTYGVSAGFSVLVIPSEDDLEVSQDSSSSITDIGGTIEAEQDLGTSSPCDVVQSHAPALHLVAVLLIVAGLALGHALYREEAYHTATASGRNAGQSILSSPCRLFTTTVAHCGAGLVEGMFAVAFTIHLWTVIKETEVDGHSKDDIKHFYWQLGCASLSLLFARGLIFLALGLLLTTIASKTKSSAHLPQHDKGVEISSPHTITTVKEQEMTELGVRSSSIEAGRGIDSAAIQQQRPERGSQHSFVGFPFFFLMIFLDVETVVRKREVSRGRSEEAIYVSAYQERHTTLKIHHDDDGKRNVILAILFTLLLRGLPQIVLQGLACNTCVSNPLASWGLFVSTSCILLKVVQFVKLFFYYQKVSNRRKRKDGEEESGDDGNCTGHTKTRTPDQGSGWWQQKSKRISDFSRSIHPPPDDAANNQEEVPTSYNNRHFDGTLQQQPDTGTSKRRPDSTLRKRPDGNILHSSQQQQQLHNHHDPPKRGGEEEAESKDQITRGSSGRSHWNRHQQQQATTLSPPPPRPLHQRY